MDIFDIMSMIDDRLKLSDVEEVEIEIEEKHNRELIKTHFSKNHKVRSIRSTIWITSNK